MKYRFVTVVAALVFAAYGCAADDASARRVSYRSYGFDITLPAGATRIQGSSVVEAYQSGSYGLAVVVAPDEEIKAGGARGTSAITALRQFGFPGTECRTGQGVVFRGACGTVPGDANVLKGKGCLWVAAISTPGQPVRMAFFATPLPGWRGITLLLMVAGPPQAGNEVDKLANWFAGSVSFTGLKMAQETGASPVAPPVQQTEELAPGKGEIALYGKVESLRSKARSLTMTVNTVMCFGQEPVDLKPPRQKVVVYKSIAKDIAVGSSVVVIGPNAGPGKPMKARVIRPGA